MKVMNICPDVHLKRR